MRWLWSTQTTTEAACWVGYDDSEPMVGLAATDRAAPLNLVFESAVLRALTSSERAGVVPHLAILLLQAAGQVAGDDDGDR